MKAKLHAKLLKKPPLIPQGQKSLRVFDIILIGLFIEICRNCITFYVRVRNNCRQERNIKIGRYGEITLDQARNRAKELRAEARLGRDPAAALDRARTMPSMQDFITEHYTPYARANLRSFENCKAYSHRIITHMGRLTLDKVQVSDIQNFKTALMREGLANGTVNRHLATVRRVLNLAIKWRVFDGPNPAESPGMLPERSRDARLTDEQVSALMAAFKRMPDRNAVAAIQVLAFTGARRDEILKARWEDLFDSVLTVPLSKSGKSRHIYLPTPVMEILNERRRHRDPANPFIFPGHVVGASLVDVRRTWNRVKKLAGLPPTFRLHDLRHNFASALVNQGVPLSEVAILLGHSDPRVTLRYAHYAPDRLIETASKAFISWTTTDRATA